jgi:hypothetical protein
VKPYAVYLRIEAAELLKSVATRREQRAAVIKRAPWKSRPLIKW